MLGERNLKILFWLAVVIIPFVLQVLFPHYGVQDVRDFFSWADALEMDWRSIYLNCRTCNYPFWGMLFSAGSAGVVKFLAYALDANAFYAFRVYLVVFDVLCSVLIYQILVALRVSRPRAWTLLLLLLPSSFVNNHIFGNIDAVSQFFILSCVLCAVFAIFEPQVKRGTLALYLGLASFFVLPLVKQLTVFSLPALILLLSFALRRHVEHLGIKKLLLLILAATPFFWLPELFVKVPQGFDWHLDYIWRGGGSNHGNKISGNGFNVWMFLGRDMYSSSTVPFYNEYTPKGVGQLFYVCYLLLISVPLRPVFKLWWNFGKMVSRSELREAVAFILFFLSLSNLGFNVFLAGTHERYLVHFYPYLLISLLTLKELGYPVNRRGLGVVCICATIYGLFVHTVSLKALPQLFFILQSHQFIAATHLFLLFGLTLFLFDCRKQRAFSLRTLPQA